ncbi:MAG: hypothetical protein PHI40_03615 [Caldisericia bacterium]|nr:hypothetical protein [Caldisericia bacterium]MDD4614481.1 hypothetical protein [Caldisericia bacterium]
MCSHPVVDTKKEHNSTLQRPYYPYSLMARFFIRTMDMITGKKTTLSKLKLLELLASIPYREWERRQYANCTKRFKDPYCVEKCKRIIQWCRIAQDNEYGHLQMIEEKTKEDHEKDAWYLSYWIRTFIIWTYMHFSKYSAYFNLPWAIFFNAQFEDHAEHCYASFIKEHPSWENQPIQSKVVLGYGHFDNWADVFRRICLDERDHRNISFHYGGRAEYVEEYPGMPDIV